MDSARRSLTRNSRRSPLTRRSDVRRRADVQAYLDGTGPAPTFTFHRFWAQSDIAMAYADYGRLFPNG